MKRPEQPDKEQQNSFQSVTINGENSFYTAGIDNHQQFFKQALDRLFIASILNTGASHTQKVWLYYKGFKMATTQNPVPTRIITNPVSILFFNYSQKI